MTEKDELEAELLNLVQERKQIEREYREIRIHEANMQALDEAANELRVLGPRLVDKLANMSIEDKQKLIGYFIPHDAYIEIFPCHPDDVQYVEVPSLSRKAKVKWTWNLRGKWNIRAVVDALKHYDKFGRMEDHIYYGQKKNTQNETL
jgi:hypothetical protein